MNKHGGHGGAGQPQQSDSLYCSFHPREVVVGVCAHCLKDRLLLLLLAAKQDKDDAFFRRRSRSSSISLPKVFALGSSFLQRLDSRHHHHEADAADYAAAAAYSDDDTTSVASLDDSFISIKFEDNGKGTWDKQQQQQQAVLKQAAPAPVRSSSSSSTAVVAVMEHVKRSGVTRWRKQVVGRLLQLARWKRSAGVVVAMDGKKAEQRSKAARGGRGWIRSLTRRRAQHGDRAWS